jgi:hypothetical protein
MDQDIINRAVNIATRAALSGYPVEKVIHIPNQMATGNPIGSFIVIPYQERSPVDTPPWDRQ